MRTRSRSAPRKSSSPRIARSVMSRDLVLEAGIIGELVDAFLADDGRIHVGDEQLAPARLARLNEDVDAVERHASAQRAALASPAKARSAASPSSIHSPKRAAGSTSRSRPSARSINLSSRRPAAISVAMAIASDKPPVALIAGPTASGKSALALALAERTGGAIINADSAQVYRDLPVLSAAPSEAERARADHRLYGVRDAAEPCSAADWAALARAEIAGLHAAGATADPGRRHRALHPHPARRDRAGAADRRRSPARGPRSAGGGEQAQARGIGCRGRSAAAPEGLGPGSHARWRWCSRPAER